MTHTKGSKIEAKRIKDERAICRDTSRFKPLKTVKIQEREKQDATQTTDRVTVPPAAVPSDTETTTTNPNTAVQEQQQQPADTVEEHPPNDINNMQEPQYHETDHNKKAAPPTIRRSEHQTKSTYEGRLKDYTK